MRTLAALASAAVVASVLAACTSAPTAPPSPASAPDAAANWRRLIDGTRGLGNFDRVGNADWTAVDGAIQATQGGPGNAYLVTRTSYRDFVVRAEFWASDDADSGILLRCRDPGRITDGSCYEANIADRRPDPTYGTGSIVNVARANPTAKAGGKWNTCEITARGKRLVVVLNGVKTVDVEDSRLAEGPVALQWARGTIRFRKVEIRAL